MLEGQDFFLDPVTVSRVLCSPKHVCPFYFFREVLVPFMKGREPTAGSSCQAPAGRPHQQAPLSRRDERPGRLQGFPRGNLAHRSAGSHTRGLVSPRRTAHETWDQIQVTRTQINYKDLCHLEHNILRLGRNLGGVAGPEVVRGPQALAAPMTPAGSAQASCQTRSCLSLIKGKRLLSRLSLFRVHFSSWSCFVSHIEPAVLQYSRSGHPCCPGDFGGSFLQVHTWKKLTDGSQLGTPGPCGPNTASEPIAQLRDISRAPTVCQAPCQCSEENTLELSQ